MRVIIFCFILFIFLAIFAVITSISFGRHPIWAFFIYSLISSFIVQKIYPLDSLKDINSRDLIEEFMSLLKNKFLLKIVVILTNQIQEVTSLEFFQGYALTLSISIL